MAARHAATSARRSATSAGALTHGALPARGRPRQAAQRVLQVGGHPGVQHGAQGGHVGRRPQLRRAACRAHAGGRSGRRACGAACLAAGPRGLAWLGSRARPIPACPAAAHLLHQRLVLVQHQGRQVKRPVAREACKGWAGCRGGVPGRGAGVGCDALPSGRTWRAWLRQAGERRLHAKRGPVLAPGNGGHAGRQDTQQGAPCCCFHSTPMSRTTAACCAVSYSPRCWRLPSTAAAEERTRGGG